MAYQIKYHQALNEKGERVDIGNVTLNDRAKHKYFCLACHQEMKAALGDHNAHYFAHISNHNCSGESYLHELAKQVLQDRFYNSEKFEIFINQKKWCDRKGKCDVTRFDKEFPFDYCCKYEDVSYDLKEEYDTCEPEVREYYRNGKKYFVPDLKITSSKHPEKDPITLEIWVTHKSTEEKKKSGKKIIEFRISEEKDALNLDQIKIKSKERDIIKGEHRSITGGIGISFYNFRTYSRKKSTDCTTPAYLCKGILYKDGNWSYDNCNCRELVNLPSGDEIAYIYFRPDYQVDIQDQVKRLFAYAEIGNFKDCYICKNYHGHNCLIDNFRTSEYRIRTAHAYYCNNFRVTNNDPFIIRIPIEADIAKVREQMKSLPKPPEGDLFQTEIINSAPIIEDIPQHKNHDKIDEPKDKIRSDKFSDEEERELNTLKKFIQNRIKEYPTLRNVFYGNEPSSRYPVYVGKSPGYSFDLSVDRTGRTYIIKEKNDCYWIFFKDYTTNRNEWEIWSKQCLEKDIFEVITEEYGIID